MISLKTFNFTSKMTDNDSIQDELTEKNNFLKSKNVQNFEYLEFNDIAFNYTYTSVSQIIKMCNNIYNNNITEIFIFAHSSQINNILACFKFIKGTDYALKSDQIKFVFLEFSESINSLQEKVNYIHQKAKNFKNNFAIAILGEINSYPNFLKLTKHIFSDIQAIRGKRFLRKFIYVISTPNNIEEFKNIRMDKNNVIILSEYIAQNNTFFTEATLFPAALIGVDILLMLKGYKEQVVNSYSIDIDNNLALKFAGYLFYDLYTSESDHRHLNILASNEAKLKNVLDIHLFMQNFLNIKNDITTIGFYGNEVIYSQGQMLIDGNKNKSVIFVSLKNDVIDYQISSEVAVNDGLNNLNINSISNYKNTSYRVLRDYLASFSSNTKIIEISIEFPNAYNLGMLVAFIYYTNIYYSMLLEKNFFYNKK